MTREEILAMEAGPQLDDALAPLLGYEVRHAHNGVRLWIKHGVPYGPKDISTTWEGMRLVVEAMAKAGWELELRYDGKRAIVGFHRRGVCRRAKFAAAPHAGALAALLAKEGGDA